MLSSMLFIYPSDEIGERNTSNITMQKKDIINHWQVQLLPNAMFGCIGLRRQQIEAIKRELRSGITCVAVSALIYKSDQNPEVLSHVGYARENWPNGYCLRWTDLKHPDGYDYLVIGFRRDR